MSERMSEEQLEEIRKRVGPTSCSYAAADCFAQELFAEIDALRADLAAARKVDDGEVGPAIGWLSKGCLSQTAGCECGYCISRSTITRLAEAKAEAERERDEAREIAALRKVDADNAGKSALKSACEPWQHCVGDPPEWDSPLMDVWQAALTWSESLIAKDLGVESYEPGDGTESLEGDYLGSIKSILSHAGMWDREEGKPSLDAERRLEAARSDFAEVHRRLRDERDIDSVMTLSLRAIERIEQP